MNTKQKDLINSLRQEGVSYSKIAFKLGMSEILLKLIVKGITSEVLERLYLIQKDWFVGTAESKSSNR